MTIVWDLKDSPSSRDMDTDSTKTHTVSVKTTDGVHKATLQVSLLHGTYTFIIAETLTRREVPPHKLFTYAIWGKLPTAEELYNARKNDPVSLSVGMDVCRLLVGMMMLHRS